MLQLEYFGEVYDRAGCGARGAECDNCGRRGRGGLSTRDITAEARAVAAAVQRLASRGTDFTLLRLVKLWRGARDKVRSDPWLVCYLVSRSSWTRDWSRTRCTANVSCPRLRQSECFAVSCRKEFWLSIPFKWGLPSTPGSKAAFYCYLTKVYL